MKKTWSTDANGVEWISDENGNRNSVAYWGSKENAEKALDSLVDCRYCRDCSSCSSCSDCRSCRSCSSCSEKIDDKDAAGTIKPIVIPKIENIHQAVYAAASNPNSLNMEDVHSCADTHCRGGWFVTLAGPEGKRLEDFLGWKVAAMSIYAESGYPEINPAKFYDDNETALADMKRLAELEAKA